MTTTTPTLASEMVEAVGGEASALPLLQFTASLLWERRDAERQASASQRLRRHRRRPGGPRLARRRRLAAARCRRHPRRSSAMLRLVTPEGTRRTVEQQEMVESSGAAGGARAQAPLRRAPAVGAQSDDVVQFELSHESLVHTWGRLRRWLDEGREESAFLDEISQAATLWAQRGRRQRNLDRRRPGGGRAQHRLRDRLKLHDGKPSSTRAGGRADADATAQGPARGCLSRCSLGRRRLDRQGARGRKAETLAIWSARRPTPKAPGAALLAGNPLEAEARCGGRQSSDSRWPARCGASCPTSR